VIGEGLDIYGDSVNIAARLETLAEPGGICISAKVHEEVAGKLDCSFRDLGVQSVKNISRKVRVYSVRAPGTRATSPATTDIALPDTPSIAVLPFQNMSSDPEQELFADGIAEEIITTLSKIPNMLVVARNSTFTYKDQSVNVKRVGVEQGVRYVLEGSIRKSGNNVRVTAQLIDATNGLHLWADRYDRAMGDIFELQDEIALKVATELQVQLTEGEMARYQGSGTKDLEAWAEQMRAIAKTRVVTKESFREARRFAESAARLDPNYSAPLCTLAHINTVEGRHGFSDSRKISIADARRCASKALELDPDNPEAYAELGFSDTLEGHHNEAIASFNTALAINPNHADVAARLVVTLAFNEQFEEAITVAQNAMRLNPRYPGWYAGVYGFALRLAGRYEEAILAFQEYGRLSEGFGLVDLAIVYTVQGDFDAARTTVDEILQYQSNFTVSNWAKTQLYADKARLQADIDALTQAGLPA
jgi:adenylate cyclase